jgi:adenine-specific DNA-methyltransferase
LKYRQLYTEKTNSGVYSRVVLPNGTKRPATADEKTGKLSDGVRLYRLDNLTSARFAGEGDVREFEYDGKVFKPKGTFKTDIKGLNTLASNGRLETTDGGLYYVRYFDDFKVSQLNNIWTDTQSGGFNDPKIYVVQTTNKVIQRCVLMTTLPGDLVLDITCGSGTTAFVAEQWGRRWITCDTSRVAIALAKKRLMTATYDYYKLADEDQGVSGGFIYKTVPHVTLKSIANNEPPAKETLYDQPEIDKTKIRISGPFTVEALPAPVGAVNAMPIDDAIAHTEDYSAKQTDWRDELLATGIIGRGGAKIEFSRIEPLSGTRYLHAEAETKEKTPRRVVIFFAGETMPKKSIIRYLLSR